MRRTKTCPDPDCNNGRVLLGHVSRDMATDAQDRQLEGEPVYGKCPVCDGSGWVDDSDGWIYDGAPKEQEPSP